MSLSQAFPRALIGTLFLALLGLLFVPAGRADTCSGRPVAPPAFSHPSGYYTGRIDVALSAPCEGAAVLFTLDGREPRPAAARYRDPLPLSATVPHVAVIRARTRMPDGTLSATATASYIMGWPSQLPIMSLVVDPADLWSEAGGIYANYNGRGEAWERPAHVSFLEPDRESGFETAAGVRLHGQASRAYAKKSFRLYFQEAYGGRLAYAVFSDSAVAEFDRLVLHNGGQDSAEWAANWTLMRTQLVEEVAREMHVYAGNSRPVLLFLNGELWGIYNLRERLDADFFARHWGLPHVEIVDSPYRAEELSAARDAWDALNNWVGTRDLADPANYAYVQTQVNLDNLIDHYILQIYTGNSDWPHHNDHLFRPQTPIGRWHWFAWDVDYSFGLSPNSAVDVDMIAWLMQPDLDAVERGGRLFRRLLENPAFRARFLARLDELLATTLHPDQMVPRIDRLEARLAADVGYEITRWSTPGNWQANVDALRDFVTRRPAIVRRHAAAGLE